MFVSSDGFNPLELNGFTLVLPAVSVGNVAQLAVDLLIATITHKKIGHIYSDCFVPVVGNNPFGNDIDQDITICNTVYANLDHKTILIQQRAPFIRGRSSSYVEYLSKWIKDCRITRVVILSSSFAHERRDIQLTGSQFRYLMTPNLSAKVHNEIAPLGWTELEKRPSQEEDRSPIDSAWPGHEIYIPGAGITRKVLQKCESEKVDAAALLVFCAEGDNARDAVVLATHFNNWLQMTDLSRKISESNPFGWDIPSSWKLQYGNSFDQILFR